MAYLHVPVWGWVAVAVGLAVLLCVDLLASSRRNRSVRMSEAAGWTLVAMLLAVGFGALLAVTSGSTPAGQFFAGWLTEYSLSLDNLLVFVILISRSPVPTRLHGRVVLAGIGIAVVLRGIVIGLGAAALDRFGWVEFLFAGFLLYTAARVARRGAGPQVAAGEVDVLQGRSQTSVPRERGDRVQLPPCAGKIGQTEMAERVRAEARYSSTLSDSTRNFGPGPQCDWGRAVTMGS